MIVPELKGKPKELTKNNSKLPANFGIQGIRKYMIKAMITKEISNARTVPHRVVLNFRK